MDQLPGTSCLEFDRDVGEWHDCPWPDGPNHNCTLGRIVGQVTYTELLSPEQADKEVDPTVRVPGARAYRINMKTVRLCEPFVEPALVGKSRRWKKVTPETQTLVEERLHDLEFVVGCTYDAEYANWGAMMCDHDHPLCNDRRDRQEANRAIKRKREQDLGSDPRMAELFDDEFICTDRTCDHLMCNARRDRQAVTTMLSMNDCDYPGRAPGLDYTCDHPICIVRRRHKAAKRAKR